MNRLSFLAALALAATPGILFAQGNTCKNVVSTAPDYTWWNGTNWLDYLEPAPIGIDARYAWRFPGGKGAGIKVFDITGRYRFTHEDLPTPFYPLNPSLPPTDYDHETGAVGIIVACDNGYGTIGIANQAQIGYERPMDERADGDLRNLFSQAISNAVSMLDPGDVIWISGDMSGAPTTGAATAVCPHKNYGHVPIEWEQWEFEAISAATRKGIVFCEASGNGEMNLDDDRYEGKFDRSVRDSGAIVVGAGQSPRFGFTRQYDPDCLILPLVERAPHYWCGYGSRVDVQARGDSITTTGIGSAVLPSGWAVNWEERYTAGYGGTSGATPIVAGAVACIQGFLKAQGRPVLTPAEIRDLLVATGIPQQQADVTGDGVVDTRHIGPLPNLRAAINALLPTSMAAGHFNNDSYEDLAIGIPYADVPDPSGTGMIIAAGKVVILMGSGNGLNVTAPIIFSQAAAGVAGIPSLGDGYGFSLAAGDFDGNGRDDLAIGAPFEDLESPPPGIKDAGAVFVIYGDSSGLNPKFRPDTGSSVLFYQNGATVGDHFGYSLEVGDFDDNGRADLAIGVPDEDVDGLVDSGEVDVLYSGAGGLGLRSEAYNQNHPQEVTGVAETGDRFGYALAAGDFDANGQDDLAVGAPFENVNSHPQAGAVSIIYGRGAGLDATFKPTLLHQDIAGVPGVAEPGDLFGYALAVGDFDAEGHADLAVGAPGEDIGDQIDAGHVSIFLGDFSAARATLRVQEFNQDTAGVPGAAESGDRFGAALATGDFDNSRINYIRDDLVVGSPGEDLPDAPDAGAVLVLYGRAAIGLDPTYRTNLFHQGQPATRPGGSPGEHFGAVLAAGRFNDSGGSQTEDLAIGVGARYGCADRDLLPGYILAFYGKGMVGLESKDFTTFPGLASPGPVRITSIRRQGNLVTIRWDCDHGRYQLQKKASLVANWVNVGDPVSGSFIALTATDAVVFYQIVSLPLFE